MRKKSHLSLAKFLMNNMKVEELNNHKVAFYLGSILPDFMPSFVTKRHNIEETFDIVVGEIYKLTVNYDVENGIDRYYARHLGVITHYLADYCTYPHNAIYPGSLKDHVYYEKDLKFSLRTYVKSTEAQRERQHNIIFQSIEEIITFIKDTHSEYLETIKNIKGDIQYIVGLCHKVVDALIQFIEITMEQLALKKQENCIECLQL